MSEHKGECKARCRASLVRQSITKSLGAMLVTAQPGEAMIELTVRDDLAQQHGFLHVGVIAAISGSAQGSQETAVALMQATIVRVRERGIVD